MRISLDVPDELHLRIRVAAAHKNQPMAEWIREALQETIEMEDDEPVGQQEGAARSEASRSA